MHDHELMRNPLVRGQVLIVATNTSTLASGRRTGAWLSTIAGPYVKFLEAGVDVTLASPEGGAIPLDPTTTAPNQQPGGIGDCCARFQENETAAQMLKASVPVAKVEEAGVSHYNALLLADGYGALSDFPTCEPLQRLVAEALQKGVVVGAIGHGASVFVGDTLRRLVAGRQVAGAAGEEEEDPGMTGEVPFLVGRRLKELGAQVLEGSPGPENVVVDGNLITAQNPGSVNRFMAEVLSHIFSNAPAGAGPAIGATVSAADVPAVLGVAPLLNPPMATTEADILKAMEQAQGKTEPSMVDNVGQAAFPNPGTDDSGTGASA